MEDRWSLADRESMLAWCRNRAQQGIRCTVALVEEYLPAPAGTARAPGPQREALRALGAGPAGASFSVKPSSIGILVDRSLFSENLRTLARDAREYQVPLEIDMEGSPLVEETLQAAFALAAEGPAPTVALQAYLDRTPADLGACLRAGLRVRLVKGAYRGDTDDFFAVQERFRALATTLMAAGVPFSAATHDPELIAWLQEQLAGRRTLVEFAFLKGLADRTKTGLAADGWQVAEYVPYGPGGDAYRLRRRRYLEMLDRLGRAPAP
jgi:proline dehydrogenase